MRGMESSRGQRNKNEFKCSLGESSFLYPSRFFQVKEKKKRMRRKEGRKGGGKWRGRGGKESY